MKKSILNIAILLSIFSVTLSSCDKDDPPQEPETVESSLIFTMDGITSTEVMRDITACSDGYFNFLGSAPDGSAIALSTGKILVNETRSICSIYLEEGDYDACIDNAGLYVGGTAFNQLYSPLSGTATRTSVNTITISGVLVAINDLTEHAFTLEATAGLVSPVNCE
jgi:hypothetical protein